MILSEETKARYTAFWDRAETDRACIYTWGIRTGGPGYPGPSSIEQRWMDAEYRAGAAKNGAENIRYFLEGFPTATTDIGPGSLAAMLTDFYRLSWDTVWFEPDPAYIEDWDSCPEIRLNTDSDVYVATDRIIDSHLKNSELYVTDMTDIGGTYDIMASMRGTSNLLYDMYEYPDEVKALRDKVAPIWADYFRHVVKKLFDVQGCMASWIPIWSDQPYYTLQCDYSAMLSPEMFREFILPDLQSQTELMPRSLYHLDGPNEIRHLDMLLSMPRLNAIQWVSGPGPNSSDPCWYDMFRQVQKAGKGLIINEHVPMDRLESLFRNISQRGLYVITSCGSEQEEKEIIDMAVKLGKEYEATHHII